MTSLPSLGELVAALPEIYQPIYGHPEFDSRAARTLEDRLAQILGVYEALSRKLGRPLRVLDLGCAQGWFDFHLARAGAEVLGIDILAANINVCNMLALENRGLKARFKLAEIEQIPALLADQNFDLVLGLSVFHHLCFHNSKEATRELVKSILDKIPAGIFEFAVNGEPVSWAAALPADPAFLIDHAPFYRQLSEHRTHLSPVNRPLYFCSSRFWYFDGQAGEFETWKRNERGRAYYFGQDTVAKLYDITGEFADSNRNAIRRAAQFLQNPPPGFPVPRLRQTGEANGQAWLVQDKIEGESLDTLLQAGTYDPRKVLKDVLGGLATLEKTGLYHGDVRTWNVLVDAAGNAHLIDYNEITAAKKDCVWPWHPFLAFFLFVHEVTTGKTFYTEPTRQPFISPYNLPEPYRSWGGAFWALPPAEWRFATLLESLEHLPQTPQPLPPPDPAAVALWMESTEQFMNSFAELSLSVEAPFRHLVDTVMANHRRLDQRIRQLEAALAEARNATKKRG